MNLKIWKRKKKLTPEQLDILTKEVNKVILEDWWEAGDALESLIHANQLAQDLYHPFDGKVKLTEAMKKRLFGPPVQSPLPGIPGENRVRTIFI